MGDEKKNRALILSKKKQEIWRKVPKREKWDAKRDEKILEMERKKGKEGQLGLIWGNQPVHSHLSHTHTQQATRLQTSCASFTHKNRGHTHTHTADSVLPQFVGKPLDLWVQEVKPLPGLGIIGDGYISQQRDVLIRSMWSLLRLRVCL